MLIERVSLGELSLALSYIGRFFEENIALCDEYIDRLKASGHL